MKIYDDPVYSIKVITHAAVKILYDIDKIQTNNQTEVRIIDSSVEAVVNNHEPEVSGGCAECNESNIHKPGICKRKKTIMIQ